MAETAQQIFDKIKEYISGHGRPYQEWYAGITSDIETRLFKDHNVLRDNGIWVYNECNNNEIARSVEDGLIRLGCDGGSGGGDQSSTCVYAYLKLTSTKP